MWSLFSSDPAITAPAEAISAASDPNLVAPIDRPAEHFDVTSTKVTDADLKWIIEHGSTTEAQTWYVHLDNGAFSLVQVVYSTMGFSPSVQVTARYYGADGKKKSKSLSLAGTSFKPSADRLSVECENIKVNYNPSNQGYHVTLDCGKEMSYNFEFTPTEALVQMNNGQVEFTDDPAGGYVKAAFAPHAKVTGTVTLDGESIPCSGVGLYVRAVQSKPQCVGKWNFVNFQSEKHALMLYEMEMPAGYDYKLDIVSIGAIVRNGKNIAVTTDNRSIQLNKEHDAFSGYKIPKDFTLKWSGKTTDGTDEQIQVELHVAPKNQIDKIDVLSELPWVLRTFIQTFITAPFLYSWYENVTAKVTVGSDTFEIEGRMFLEASYLMTMP